MSSTSGPPDGAPRPPPQRASTLLIGFVVVAASMVAMFTVPSHDFLAAAYGSTACMAVAGYLLSGGAQGYSRLFRPRAWTIVLGLSTAALLYLVFYAGNLGITAFHPFGISASNEGSIYSLISSPGNPAYIQVGVLAFDSVGYESFFRGVLQARLQPRTGLASVFIVALVDASLHVFTLNPLWMATTFIADSAWGLTYFYSKDLSSNITSHFVWDVFIFIVLPIK
jgi:membrane protease YdiL (CAAX protease family)